MPLVNATDDNAFVTEVSEEMDVQARRGREHTAAMIDEYLRRRLAAADEHLAAALSAQEARLRAEFSVVQAGRDGLLAELAASRAQLLRAADAMGRAADAAVARRCLAGWTAHAQRRRADQQRAALEAARTADCHTFRAYLKWRLQAAERRQRQASDKEARQLRCTAAELSGQIEVYREELAAERERGAAADERLRAAFVRGVSALNREAVQVLRGGEGGGGEPAEGDVAAIEEILSRDAATPSAAGGAANARSHRGFSSSGHFGIGAATAAAGAASGHRHQQDDAICPVHHTDAENNFYHRCYAPQSCDYSYPHHHHHRAGDRSVRVAPQPFVVRAEPFSNTPSLVVTPASKPASPQRSSSAQRWR